MAKYTSRVFVCWQALYEALAAASWPPHPTTGERPPVIFCDDPNPPDEAVIVVGVPEGQPSQDWHSLGAPAQRERFVLRVLVGTRVAGQERVAVLSRIVELSELVQTTLRDPTRGHPVGITAVQVPGLIDFRVASVRPQLYPMPEGWGAYAEVDVAFHAQI